MPFGLRVCGTNSVVGGLRTLPGTNSVVGGFRMVLDTNSSFRDLRGEVGDDSASVEISYNRIPLGRYSESTLICGLKQNGCGK